MLYLLIPLAVCLITASLVYDWKYYTFEKINSTSRYIFDGCWIVGWLMILGAVINL